MDVSASVVAIEIVIALLVFGCVVYFGYRSLLNTKDETVETAAAPGQQVAEAGRGGARGRDDAAPDAAGGGLRQRRRVFGQAREAAPPDEQAVAAAAPPQHADAAPDADVKPDEEDPEEAGRRERRRQFYDGETDVERQEREAEEAAAEEYATWKSRITVDEAGTHAPTDGADTRARVVAHVKERRLVVLEHVAAKLGMRTVDVLSAVRAAERAGEVMGVLDDRGKYVTLTEGDVDAMAEWVRSKGSFTKPELVAAVEAMLRR